MSQKYRRNRKVLSRLEVPVKVRKLVLAVVLLLPGLVAAQKPDAPANPQEPVLWEFDTGG